MNRLWLLLIASALLLGGCSVNMSKDARFGMFGGKQEEPKPEPPFDINSTLFGTRWFPAHVRWAPDDSHLLVSLCHVNRAAYCRIGKYWIAENRWELLNLQPRITYRWPSYSPDGKHIVASAGGCDESYRCPIRRYALILLTPDAKRTFKLADTIAIHPTFSDDGKKLIYWRSNGIAEDVAQFDLATGKEQMLMQMYWWGDQRGWAFFLPGGERFVFAGWLQPNDQLKDDIKSGSKLDPHGGPNPDVIMYAVDIPKGLVTRRNARHLEPLWPGPGGTGTRAGPVDVSRNGEVLYNCPVRGCLAEKLKAGTFNPGDVPLDTSPSTQQNVLMLRPAREDASDTAAFIYYGSAQSASAAISADGLRVAFSEASPTGWHHTNRLGIITRGNPYPASIEWPRLELDPAATQPITK